MGCTKSTHANAKEPEIYPVPFGHVPYAPVLPGVMGPLWNFPMEWWFYGGWASDSTKSKQFTILLYSLRVTLDGGILYGIGVHEKPPDPDTPDTFITKTDDTFITKTDRLALGKFPAPTSSSWSTAIETMNSAMSCKLTSGTLGLAGATYQVDMDDKTNNINITLSLKDTLGLVQEGNCGAFPGIDTCQFAMPALTIQEGSNITIAGETTQLANGNIWLERQSVKLFNIFKPLYLGNWLAITMKDQTHYTISFYWQKKEEKGKQWIVGTEVGFPPTSQSALEYPGLPDRDGNSPIQGVIILEKHQFDLNILIPTDPEKSPHWKSSTNEEGNTYCTAWKLKLKDKVYKMTALLPGSEVWLDTYFSEGTATLCDEISGEVAGHAFVEQMGYN